MKDVIDAVAEWRAAGQRVALATLYRVAGSSPQPPGAAMAVAGGGEVVGSVSGGCVEGALYEQCMKVIDGAPAHSMTYGISDDEAFEVGLTCGGILDVFVEPVTWGGFGGEFGGEAAKPGPARDKGGRVDSELRPLEPSLLERLRAALATETPCALATVVAGTSGAAATGKLLVFCSNDRIGSLGTEGLDHAVAADAAGSLAHGETELRHYGPAGERRMDDVTVLIQAFAPPPRFYIFGAIDFAAALCRAAKTLGYRVTVIDARATFATSRRFPDADEVVVAWPPDWLASAPVDTATAIAILTHDPKFDDPLIVAALASGAGYIGAMGSRKTTSERHARLLEDGVSEAHLAHVSAPIGLDLGARTPQETAISILAEIVALRAGRSGGRLSGSADAIHS